MCVVSNRKMAIFLKLCCCFFLLVHVAICHEPVVHNFVAQPFGQLLSEEVTLVSVKNWARFIPFIWYP